MDRRDRATAEAAVAPDAVTHAAALLRKLADGSYRVEVRGEPGAPAPPRSTSRSWPR